MWQNPCQSARKLANLLEFQVSANTVWQVNKEKGFGHQWIKPKKVFSEIHKGKRREYAASHVTWSSTDWVRVVFTEKKHWNLSRKNCYISHWNKPKRRTHGVKFHLQIWHVASNLHGGLNNCWCLCGYDFFNELHKNLPEDFVWMHDNAPPPVALRTKAYLERMIKLIKFNQFSPNLCI